LPWHYKKLHLLFNFLTLLLVFASLFVPLLSEQYSRPFEPIFNLTPVLSPISLAMFAPSLSLGLALLPFAAAAVHDVQVGGAGGALVYDPEAIVCDQLFFDYATTKRSTFPLHIGCTTR
jgi:hypothetical protein